MFTHAIYPQPHNTAKKVQKLNMLAREENYTQMNHIQVESRKMHGPSIPCIHPWVTQSNIVHLFNASGNYKPLKLYNEQKS